MKRLKEALINFAIDRNKRVIFLFLVLASISGLFLPRVVMDTDPENMLMKSEPARIFHNETKKEFELSETVVVGIINDSHPDGVFNPGTLNYVYQLTEFSRTLRWPDEKDPGKTTGVIEVDMVAPSLVDHMSQAGPGTIRFEWLMPEPPKTREEALAVREKALSNPLLKGQMVSEDGKAICIYLPLTDKLTSYRVYTALRGKIKEFKGSEEYHVSGLPVAESAIGIEMFTQMGVGSALSMAVIFALLFLFFRKWVVVVLPVIIATISIVLTMGIMIACGFPVHILSSMLPIFLMSISMVDSVHIISEFSDVYTKEKGRKETLKEVMNTLFSPMLYTSLTTAAGFASLTFAPIPPGQVFGAFLSIGAMLAWIVTILFVPAYVMMVPEARLSNFGLIQHGGEKRNWLSRFLRSSGRLSCRYSKPLLGVFIILVGIAVWGITRIRVNDNYAKRFVTSHPIRGADIALNRHFEGTYTAYLVLEEEPEQDVSQEMVKDVRDRAGFFMDKLGRRYKGVGEEIEDMEERMSYLAGRGSSLDETLSGLIAYIEDKDLDNATDEEFDFYQDITGFLGVEKERLSTFKRPDVLRYMVGLQDYLVEEGFVGKSTSVADVARKVNQELTDGKQENFKIPGKLEAVAECYMQFQQSHRPRDLWHMVTPDFKRANIRFQFTTGDSAGTREAVDAVDKYFLEHAPPVPLRYRWAGLHYINRVLEQRLVWGFLKSFIGSFIIVFVMMWFLFRSPLWAALCMLPLTITLIVIYGMTGIVGKDYDLPIAVLSALSIGMAVDFAIHFLERSRMAYREKRSWKKVAPGMFGGPARAISRNVLVIAIGFLPLLVAPLIPYKTTGVLLFGILAVSGMVTILVLPAILTVAEKSFFKKGGGS